MECMFVEETCTHATDSGLCENENRGQKVGRDQMCDENERIDLDGNDRVVHFMLTASAAV